MSIGTGIFLVAIGAVLTFALDGSLGGGVIDIDLVGYILMGSGTLVLLLGLIFMMKKRKTVSTSSTSLDPNTNQRVSKQETQTSI